MQLPHRRTQPLRVLDVNTPRVAHPFIPTSQVESSRLLMLLSHGSSRAPAAPCSTASASGTASSSCPVKPLQVQKGTRMGGAQRRSDSNGTWGSLTAQPAPAVPPPAAGQ
jgi:hypothetical protein